LIISFNLKFYDSNSVFRFFISVFVLKISVFRLCMIILCHFSSFLMLLTSKTCSHIALCASKTSAMYFFKTVRTMLFLFCVLTIVMTIRSIFAFFNVLFIVFKSSVLIFEIDNESSFAIRYFLWFWREFLGNQILFACICIRICICICVCICICACDLSCFLRILELLRWFLRILHDLRRLRNLRLLQDLQILCHLLCVDFLFDVFSILLNQL